MPHKTDASSTPLTAVTALIVGAGFGGIGMGVALRKAGIENFVIVEKAEDLGGVWRDNRYPGAACDVPSHLYSFSFEPNPNWSRAFSPQAEIQAYLKHCAEKYALMPHLRLGTAVEEARWDETRSLWLVRLSNGDQLEASLFISATGQLSRPALPRLPGLEDFKGRAFHSARWDQTCDLTGQRVAVIGTGASAIQFVPAIAGKVQSLSVFQRSAAYILPRVNHPYRSWQKALFRSLPWATKLYRAAIYTVYESRALGFTRFKGLMQIAAVAPFKRMLKKQVPDAARRAQLMPNYPVGCKRLLLSSEYLKVMAQPHVDLVTEGIQRVTATGIETADGKTHEVDTLIFGTGFTTTEFLAPMRIKGRNGLDLNEAWRDGAQAYLGLSVPGFPNLFMIYGPNTNLGHNSIIYMLESQIAHVMARLKAMRRLGADSVEVDAGQHRRHNADVQRGLARSVWNGCSSWYLDAQGRNSSNWPGFTLSYRWMTSARQQPYQYTRRLGNAVSVPAPEGWIERGLASYLRGFLRVAFRPWIGPPFKPSSQRRWVALMGPLMPPARGVERKSEQINGVPCEIVRSRSDKAAGVILYLHGGAFLLGGPRSHASITSQLAADSGMKVCVADYRLAPEHPYPAALDDAHAVYRGLLAQGERVVIAGDSVGGWLALMLTLRLRDAGEPLPAGLMLISPVTDNTFSGASLQANASIDPMIRQSWVAQGVTAFSREGMPVLLSADLRGLPPLLIQVGTQEVLLSDSTRLAERAEQFGVSCRLEIHEQRWHVFHLQRFYLRSARRALGTMAAFALDRVRA